MFDGATGALMLGRLTQDAVSAVSLANQIAFIMNLFIGASYLRTVGLSYLFNGITSCYYMKMKIEGKASKSVMISIVTLISDVVIDTFLIYGLAGVPKLWANGFACSTVFVEPIGRRRH